MHSYLVAISIFTWFVKTKHLRRAGALLAALLIMVFIVPRILPPVVVESLQAYGFYRGTSTQEWANQPVQYKDPKDCVSCHQVKYEIWSKAGHDTVVCENCHGPGSDHVAGKATPVVDKSSDLCQTCHQKLASRPAQFPQVVPGEHGTAPCLSCHDPHRPAVQFPPTIAHDLNGKTDCLVCHKMGAIKPYPKEHEGRSLASCLACHKPE